MTARAAAGPPVDRARNTVVSRFADAPHALQELQDSWARAAAGGGHALTAQALLTTIVARYPSPASWSEVYAALAPVVVAYPARVLALVHDPASARSPRPAEVGLITSTGRGGQPVLRGEMILAALDDRAFREAAALVASWSAAGVPLVVWWRGPAPAEDHLLDDLRTLADRIAFDSGEMADVAAGFAALHDALVRAPASLLVTDLLWLRLRPWRQAIAQLFDPPAHRAHLGVLQACVVEAAPDPSAQAAAHLLAGWLVSRLRWDRGERQGRGVWTFRRGERTVQLSVQPGAWMRGPEMAVSLGAGDATVVARRGATDHVLATIEVAGRTTMRTLAPVPVEAHQVWSEELMAAGADRTDRAVLADAVSAAHRLLSA